MKIPMNDGWRFTEKFHENLLKPEFDEETLKEVRLPHTAVETPFNCFDESIYQKVMGYRKVLRPDFSWKGKALNLTFEGAAHKAEVYLNGQLLGIHRGGYTAFSIDLSPHIVFGKENILGVKLDSRETLNFPPFGYVIDFLTYGGLYREAYLEVLPKIHVKDVFVRTENVLQDEKTVVAQVSLSGFDDGEIGKAGSHKAGTHEAGIPEPIKATFSLYDLRREKRREIGMGSIREEISTHTFNLKDVELWEIDDPALYTFEVRLEGGKEIHGTTFGFREISFQKEGFYLNGEKVKLRGLNRHQSYPYVGYAMPKSPQILDADILKYELGVNAVRTSHYPQSKHFIRRCDEIGLLVFTEIPGWQHIGDEQWKKAAYEQVKEMVVQYRNHPSIFIWGVRINESPDDHEFYSETNRIARELDPARATGGVRYIKNSEMLEDVYTYNDFSHSGKNPGIEKKGKVTPEKNAPYFITEYNGHMYPTKAFDDESHRLNHALRHARVLNDIYKEKDVLGGFGWAMFDYNTHKDFGSGDRICYHGVMDFFRNKKLAAEVYASQQEKDPILAISSNMDVGEYPGSFRGDLYAFTNGDEVRLYKNDQFIQSFTRENTAYPDLPNAPIVIDDVLGNRLEEETDLSPGKIRDLKEILLAVTKYGPANLPLSMKFLALKMMVFHKMSVEEVGRYYTRFIGDWGQEATTYHFEAMKNGNFMRSVVKKTMKQVDLSLNADRHILREEGTYDVATLRIKALCENGNLLSYLSEPLIVETEGPIEVIGPKILTLRGGMTGTYIKSLGKPGNGKVTIRLDHRVVKTLSFTVEIEEWEEGGEADDFLP